MKALMKNRLRLVAQLPTVLLALALGVGTASVGHANEVSTMTITAQRPDSIESVATYRNEVQARARVVIWKMRYSAMSDLELKLNNNNPSNVRLAGTFSGDRG